MLGQGEAHEEEEEEEQTMTREEELAALVRAAQADQENLSGQTQEMIDQASATQRAEELAETASVWTGSGSREIEMSEEKIETIKSLMSGVVLGNVPAWANTLDPNKIGGNTQKADK